MPRSAAIALGCLLLVGCAQAPAIQHAPDALDADRARLIRVVAHRGAPEQAPENTFAAARVCVEWGVDFIEVDVRSSSDGVLYLFHDAKLHRTTRGRGRIDRTPSARIDALEAGAWFGDEWEDEPVPRLADFLQWAKDRIGVYIDVKKADPAAVARVVRASGWAHRCTVGFKDEALSREFARLAPEIELKMNARSLDDVRRAKDVGAHLVEIPLECMTPQIVEACSELGLEIMAPIFDRDERLYELAIRWGVDRVNVDHGDAFLAVRKRLLRAP